MKRCACIDTLYTELPFEERIGAAKADGFESVEFWDWRIRDLDRVKEAAEAAGITVSGFNGDADFSLVDPTHKEKYLAALRESMEAAKKVGAPTVTIHSNALGEGGVVVNHYTELSDTVKLCSMYDTLLAAVKIAEKYQIRMNLEALNIKVDHVGNFLQIVFDQRCPCFHNVDDALRKPHKRSQFNRSVEFYILHLHSLLCKELLCNMRILGRHPRMCIVQQAAAAFFPWNCHHQPTFSKAKIEQLINILPGLHQNILANHANIRSTIFDIGRDVGSLCDNEPNLAFII